VAAADALFLARRRLPSEAISQACSNSTGRWRENTGVRPLPARQALDLLAQVGLEGRSG
jgi:hypothetical protein